MKYYVLQITPEKPVLYLTISDGRLFWTTDRKKAFQFHEDFLSFNLKLILLGALHRTYIEIKMKL